MTLIREFKITNLAGKTGVTEKKLHPKTNIFWGLNGSGKTTLLKILSSALQNNTSGLEKLPFDAAEVRFYSHTADLDIIRRYKKPDKDPREISITLEKPRNRRIKRSITIDADQLDIDLPSSESVRWETELVSDQEDPTISLMRYRQSYLPITRHLDPGDSDYFHSNLDSPDERFVRLLNRVWSRYRAKSLSTIRDVQQQGLAEVLGIVFGGTASGDRLDILTVKSNQPAEDESADNAFNVVSQFLLDQGIVLPLGESDFKQKYLSSELNRHVATLIREVMGQVETILMPQKELQTVINEMFSGNKHLLLDANQKVEVENNEESIPLWALSSGEKQLLHILLETLAIEESTIMIDEPELSLHPDWQLGLVNSMRRVNAHAQFILASHSPELMVGVEDECVFEL